MRRRRSARNAPGLGHRCEQPEIDQIELHLCPRRMG
jgi:hypothetical protein